ncbi:MAG: DUF4258 domain-containing protein [Chloroflexi bacterium]|nr:DUF4258 domain-containing protein [Chloroflexota bacterium]MYD54865.1 DUF4258 domain-containing protein [Chloroflexota bacterium]MYD74521.1 DUF4258 domain-containing protein [Chloroflexota bacterium]MYG91002.1 DUF4258 domain-containing protein [Chloroflexota bacterium]MYJ92552.1 DUF4258 domain-containing protein [Chloroflexota bacterium]
MKVTEHFNRSRLEEDRKWIELEWIEQVIANPLVESVQSDGRIRRWGTVPELNGRYLRVVLLPDGETVMTAFLDRRFRP